MIALNKYLFKQEHSQTDFSSFHADKLGAH